MAKSAALNVLVFGGTIASEITQESVIVKLPGGREEERIREITIPKRGKIEELLKHQVPPEVKNIFRAPIAIKESEVFLDSADFQVDTLEEAVQNVRRVLRETRGNIIICAGTDATAFLSQAMADGISADGLTDRNIIITMAQYASPKRPEGAADGPIDQGRSDAAKNLTNAIYLSSRERFRGQIGVCVDQTLYSARGSRKIQTSGYDPLQNRFPSIAKKQNGEKIKWLFDDECHNTNIPGGLSGVSYKLLPGVESFSVDPLSNYQNLVDIMEFASKKTPRTLNAMILSAPGSCNLRSNPRDCELIENAARIGAQSGIPLIITSDPMQPQETEADAAVYVGNALNRKTSLVNGRRLMVPELKMVVAQTLYTAMKIKKIYHPEKILGAVDSQLELYSEFVSGEMTLQEYTDILRKMRE